jgi:hypothetical protein
MEMTSTVSAAGSGGFHSFAGRASQVVGSKWAFTLALSPILAWANCGPYFHYSDTWQLVVNYGDDRDYVLDGASNSEYAEPRRASDSLEVR